MSDIWINAFVMIKTKHTDDELKEIGKLVLKALRDKWNENTTETYTEITVGTS